MVGRNRRRPHRPLSIDASHWRADGRPKVRYPSQGDALNAAEDRARQSDVALGVYSCDFCGGWHMGSRNGRE